MTLNMQDTERADTILGIAASFWGRDVTIRFYGDSLQVWGNVTEAEMRSMGFSYSDRHGFWWRKWAE